MSSNTAVPVDTNFWITRGDAASFTLTVTLPTGLVDLNDYAIVLSAKNAFTDPNSGAVFQLSKVGGQITVDSVLKNVAHIVLDTEASEDLDCPPPLNRTVLQFDIEVIGPDTRPYTVARGQLTVVADVTRNT